MSDKVGQEGQTATHSTKLEGGGAAGEQTLRDAVLR